MVEQPKWEYLVVTTGQPELTNVLTSLGMAGWEAYAVSVQFTTHYVWLKRRLQEQ
jgi:hypothetical protein